jgi:hypothetical protein
MLAKLIGQKILCNVPYPLHSRKKQKSSTPESFFQSHEFSNPHFHQTKASMWLQEFPLIKFPYFLAVGRDPSLLKEEVAKKRSKLHFVSCPRLEELFLT